MLRERGDFRRFERDAGELRHGIEKQRDRRCVRHAAVMGNEHVRFVSRLVVMRGFDQRCIIAEFRGPLCERNRFRCGFRARPGNEFLLSCRCFFRGAEDSFHLRFCEQNRLTGGTEYDITGQVRPVVLLNVVFQVREGNRSVAGKWRG